MSNSSLVVYTQISPNKDKPRNHAIDRITPHCTAEPMTAEEICACFMRPEREASCNYGIGGDGRVSLCVDESDRSWCSSSRENDHRAITIECCSEDAEPYAMNDKVYQRLIELCADICTRHGKTKLLWLADKEKTLVYEPQEGEMVLSVHRWFADKSCPGDWLYERLGDLAERVTERLQ